MASAHAVLGFAAQWLGVYVLAVAGTSLLPGWLRFSNYKAVDACDAGPVVAELPTGMRGLLRLVCRVPEIRADARPSSAASRPL
jgi:hypothetical protein